MKARSGRGTTKKHAGTVRHVAKHHPAAKKKAAPVHHKAKAHHVAKPAKPARPRKLTPDESVALCSARAVAESLRLALGVAASDDDVMELYFRIARDPDEGAAILAMLHAAATFGLAGAKVAGYESAGRDSNALTPISGHRGRTPGPATRRLIPARPPALPSLILGVALPEGDHAVLAAPGGTWWSWGQPYPRSAFPGAVVEEAWEVRWAA